LLSSAGAVVAGTQGSGFAVESSDIVGGA